MLWNLLATTPYAFPGAMATPRGFIPLRTSATSALVPNVNLKEAGLSQLQIMAASPEPVTKPRTSLVAGASWLLASKICSFAITSALPFILTRRLSQTEYGYYKQLFLILTTTLNLLPFGMNMSLFYFIPRAKSQAEKGHISLNVVIFYLITTGILGGSFMVSPALIGDLFHSEPLTRVGWLIGLTMIPYVVSSLLEIVLIANGDARLAAVSGIAINMGRTLLILGGAFIWGTIDSILWCVFAVAVLQFGWLAIYLATRFGNFWTSFRWSGLWAQLIYALPLGLSGLLWALQVDVDNYFVSHYFNAAMFAIYATGCFDVPLVGMLSDSVGSVLIPRISALQANNSIQEIIDVTVKAIRGLAFAYAPTFVFVSIAAKQVITVLFPEKYLASVPIFRVNLLMVLLAILAVDPVLRAFKTEYNWLLRVNIALLALLCAGLYFGTPRFGLVGAVSCVIIVQYIARSLLIWRIIRLLRVRWVDLRPLGDVLKTLLVAGVAGICIAPLLSPIQRWGALASAAVCGMIYSGIYLVGLFLLKVPSEAEIEWFYSKTVGTLKTRLGNLGVG
jgi:O-antigen/teichoic acid export membrane protein